MAKSRAPSPLSTRSFPKVKADSSRTTELINSVPASIRSIPPKERGVTTAEVPSMSSMLKIFIIL